MPDVYIPEEKGIFWTSLTRRICAGQSLICALKEIREELPGSSLVPIINDIAGRIESGESLADAMKLHAEVFGLHTICFVEGGERAGILDRALMLISEASWRCPKCILG